MRQGGQRWRSWRAIQFRLQSFNAQVDGLPVLLDQGSSLAFRLDEQRQTIPHVNQASHSSEGVIDRRRHGSYGHFDELVDSVFDILGGVRWFPIWKALRICPSNPSSNRPAGQTRATTAPRLKK